MARFSLVMTRNAAIERAITAIDADAWTPVRYPGAVADPDTGEWISDAETLRRRIVTVPARLARPQRRPILHLPTHWPWVSHWLTLWRNTIGYSPPLAATV